MANKETILTSEGLKKLEAELEEFRNVRRPQVAERLKIAISYGDISENSEYDDAKSEQAFIEGRIFELEQMIKTATIIDENAPRKKGEVSLGSTVLLKDMATGEEETYTIVGTTETDPFNNRISNESPVGAAILAHKEGEIIAVNTPMGELSYEIMEIK